jgi:hypothetical protein
MNPLHDLTINITIRIGDILFYYVLAGVPVTILLIVYALTWMADCISPRPKFYVENIWRFVMAFFVWPLAFYQAIDFFSRNDHIRRRKIREDKAK